MIPRTNPARSWAGFELVAPRGVKNFITIWPCYPPTENVITAILKSFFFFYLPF